MRVAAVVGVLALLAAGALSFLLARDDGDNTTEPRAERRAPREEPAPEPEEPAVELVLAITGAANHAAGPPVEVPPELQMSILASVQQYVDVGLLRPLATSKPVTDEIAGIFDQGTVGRLSSLDRGVLFDEGLPKVRLTNANSGGVFLTGLSDGTGTIALVTAGFIVELQGETRDGPVKLSRSLELTFANDNGTWRITGYDVRVLREGAGIAMPVATAQA